MRAIGPTDVAAPLVLFFHGRGGNVSDMFNNTAVLYPVRDALLAGGFIVAASDAHSAPPQWGTAAELADYVDLYNWAAANFTVSKVLIFGSSMGGIASLLTLTAGTIPNIAGWAGSGGPACSLRAVYDGGLYGGDIDTAYDIPGGGDYDTQTAGHDPLLVSASSYAGKFMRFYASPDDTTIPKVDHTDAMVAHVSGVTAESSVFTASGSHGSASHFQGDDLVAFFRRCLAA